MTRNVSCLPPTPAHWRQTVATDPYVRRHLRTYYGGVLAEESIAIFQRYAPQALAYLQNGGAPPAVAPPLAGS